MLEDTIRIAKIVDSTNSEGPGNQQFFKIGRFVECTKSEGLGKRFAVWFQGCNLRCADCCNPELFEFTGGIKIKCDDFIALVLKSKKENEIEGITYLGGETMLQNKAMLYVNKILKENGLNIWVYSGYYIDEIQKLFPKALNYIDLLIDGRFEKDKIINNIRYIGSSNQTIHFLTDEFKNRKSEFDKPNSFEVKFKNGKIHLVGWANSLLKFEKFLNEN